MEQIIKPCDSINFFIEYIEKNICGLSQVQKKQYVCFFKILLNNNLKYNLYSRKEKDIIERHFINSILFAYYFKLNSKDNILDIGTGGGFPGIILKILFTDSSFVLVDSIKKKTDFLKCAVSELGLKNIIIENNRIENLQKKYTGFFDFITARAVASLDQLYLFSKELVKPNGTMVFFKGKNYEKETGFLEVKGERPEFEILHFSEIPFASGSQDGVIVKIHLPQ